MNHTKTALVSGANGNLGRAVVDYFLKRGWHVIGLIHKPDVSLPNVSEFEAFVVDLMEEQATLDCFQQIIKKYATIDATVLTAGGFRMGTLSKTTMADIRLQYRLNFETAYNLVRPLSEVIKTQGFGNIFFIGSQQGMDTRRGKSVVAYSLAKSQLFQLANILNADAVQAFVVVPSIIDTPQNRKDMPNTDFSKWEKPSDIAQIIGKYQALGKETDKSVLVISDELNNL